MSKSKSKSKPKEKFAVIVETKGKTYNLGTANSIAESDRWAKKFLRGQGY